MTRVRRPQGLGLDLDSRPAGLGLDSDSAKAGLVASLILMLQSTSKLSYILTETILSQNSAALAERMLSLNRVASVTPTDFTLLVDMLANRKWK